MRRLQRLGVLLRLREARRARAGAAFGAAARHHRTSEQLARGRERDASEGACHAALHPGQNALAGPLDGAAQGVEWLRRGVDQALAELERSAAATETARETFLRERTRVRALEELRARLERRERAERERGLQRELDEIAVRRHVWRRSS